MGKDPFALPSIAPSPTVNKKKKEREKTGHRRRAKNQQAASASPLNVCMFSHAGTQYRYMLAFYFFLFLPIIRTQGHSHYKLLSDNKRNIS